MPAPPSAPSRSPPSSSARSPRARVRAQASPYLPLDDPAAAAARAPDRAGRHRRPLAHGPAVPARRRGARAGRRRHRRRGARGELIRWLRPSSTSPGCDRWRLGRAGPVPRPTATSAATCFIRSARTVSGPTRTSPARRCIGRVRPGQPSGRGAEARRRPGVAGPARPRARWRLPEAYVSAQFKYGSVFYGQMDRNWGPGRASTASA